MNSMTAHLSRQAGRPGYFTLAAIALLFMTGTSHTCLARAPDAVRLKKREVITWVDEQPNGDRFLKARILMRAPRSDVWDAVRTAQDANLTSSFVQKTISASERIVEERYDLPVLGKVWCVRHVLEVPYQRIHFKMLQSDQDRKSVV